MDIHRWIQENLPLTATIVEAGTASGDDTVFFAKHFPAGKIHGFEPIPPLYLQTYFKISSFPNVRLYPLALAEKTQSYTFYESEQNGQTGVSSSLLKPKDHLWFHPHVLFQKELEVGGKNLDEWRREEGIENIDLLWLDIQGAEPAVLRAAPETLKRIHYLYTEVSLIETYERVELYGSFRKFLEEAGFEVVDEQLPYKDMGNVLFRNRCWQN